MLASGGWFKRGCESTSVRCSFRIQSVCFRYLTPHIGQHVAPERGVGYLVQFEQLSFNLARNICEIIVWHKVAKAD
jgi:hypothetical protein